MWSRQKHRISGIDLILTGAETSKNRNFSVRIINQASLVKDSQANELLSENQNRP
jgi:hypothetical protein